MNDYMIGAIIGVAAYFGPVLIVRLICWIKGYQFNGDKDINDILR